MEYLHRIDPEEMEKIKQLENRAKKLHLPSQGLATFSIELFDKKGNLKALYGDRSRSWVRNKYNLLVNQMLGVGGSTSPWDFYGEGGLMNKVYSGGLVNLYYLTSYSSTTPFCSPAGTTTYGIQIGTSGAAESIEDYLLGSMIAHGTNAGEMEYGDTTKATTWEAGVSKFKCSLIRHCVNNSGGSIGVNELGLMGYYNYTSSTRQLLQVRDVLASTVNVAHEEQIRVTYNLYSPAYP